MADREQELLAFALDLYRAPLKYLRFVAANRPLPAGLDALLDALNKRPDTEFWRAMGRQLDVSQDELRNAGFFLVKRLLFADGADYYRILGVDSDADIARIRERYRLLMALFHPDRIHQRDEWTEQYAPKINEAYSTLKNPDKKRAYDHALDVQEDPWGDDIPLPGGSPKAPSEPRYSAEFRSLDAVQNVGRGSRHRPKSQRLLVLTGVALFVAVVALGVLLRRGTGPNVAAEGPADAGLSGPLEASDTFYQAHSDESAVGSETAVSAPVEIAMDADSAPVKRANREPVAGSGPLVTARPPEPDAQQGRGEALDTGGGVGTASTVPESTATDIRKTPVVRQESVPQRSSKMPQIDDGNPRPNATPPPTSPIVAAGGSSKETTDSASVKVASRPVKATTSAVGRSFVNQRDIDLLISRFIHAYEAGDTEKFISLFSYRVKTKEAVGRDAIARQYGKFFRTTENRSLVIKDLKWVPKGVAAARITFFADIQVEPSGSFARNDYQGEVDLYVRIDETRLSIVEFIHQVGK